MPILHCLPRSRSQECRLLAIYHDRLREQWAWPDRTFATGLAAIGIGTGWAAIERRVPFRAARAAGPSRARRRGVHRILNPAGYPLSDNLLRNKALFARHVVDAGLAAPDTFMPCKRDLADWLGAHQAVIAKRGYSSKGRGVAAFRREGGHWRGTRGNFNSSQLATCFQSYLSSHGVVQELLTTHPGLVDLS